MPDSQPSTPDSAGVERTATGTIADQGQTTTTAATTAQTSTTAESTDDKSLINATEEKSLANQKGDTPAAVAPEAYAEFKVPDGYVLDEAVAKEAGGIFKEMNLTQEQAQKLVDFYTAKTTESQNRPYQVWRDTQQKWVNEVKADPFMGPRLNHVTSTISKGIDQVVSNNPQLSKLAEGFREVMDFTGAGNHPAFIRMFYEMASMITEGGHVSGRGPSPAGQQSDTQRTSAARAMYPNLP
jgi:Spy/CpxP family protein refolding chaperone